MWKKGEKETSRANRHSLFLEPVVQQLDPLRLSTRSRVIARSFHPPLELAEQGPTERETGAVLFHRQPPQLALKASNPLAHLVFDVLVLVFAAALQLAGCPRASALLAYRWVEEDDRLHPGTEALRH